MQQPQTNLDFEYKYGFSMPQKYTFKSKKGLDEDVVRNISRMKQEPVWMTDFRLKAYHIFKQKVMPAWGADLSDINFDDIYYYIKPTDKQVDSWDKLPKEIKESSHKESKYGRVDVKGMAFFGDNAVVNQVVIGDLVKALESEIKERVVEGEEKKSVLDSLKKITNNETFASVTGVVLGEVLKRISRP